MTRVKTLIFSKYLVGSRANPWHGHVVGKSLLRSIVFSLGKTLGGWG